MDLYERAARAVDHLESLSAQGKAAAILAGASGSYVKSADPEWLGDFVAWKAHRDSDAEHRVKAVLGTSTATGAALIPGNMVSDIAERAARRNVFRQAMNIVTGVPSNGVDIPYEVTASSAALLQGAFGSNKDNRDFTLASATAVLYTIAQITDLSNQLLRRSAGAAEQLVRRRFGKSFGMAESAFIVNGSGSGAPLGIMTAFLAHGDPAEYKTTLASEPRVATIGRAISAVQARGEIATHVILHPTDFAEAVTEGLGTSYAGGWAVDPAAGPASGSFTANLWGLPVLQCSDLTVGTGLTGNFADQDIYLGLDGYRIDVSTEAGDRFDRDLTGLRAEEDFGYNAEPYVRSGMMQKILGI